MPRRWRRRFRPDREPPLILGPRLGGPERPAPPPPPEAIRPDLWRSDEAPEAAPAEPELGPQPEIPSEPLWRPDEGKRRARVATAPETIAPPRESLWKDHEGRLTPAPGPVDTSPASSRSGSTNGGRRESKPAKGPAPRSRRRATRLAVWIVATLALMAFLGDATYSIVKVAGSLDDAKDSLERGRTAFEAGDLTVAKSEFQTALEHSRDASGYSDRPALSLLSHLPLIGPDAGALQTLSTAGEMTSEAGVAAVRSGKLVGVQPDGFAETLYDNGQVQLGSLTSAEPIVDEVAALIQKAEAALEEAPEPFLGYVQGVLRTSRDEIGDAGETIERGQALVRTLPVLLGGDEPRRYFLAFQAPGEARATGGLVGLYGILEASEGELSLSHVGPVKDVFPDEIVPPVGAPGWFRRAYGPQTALQQIQQANVSPNFPVVSQVMLDMYERVTGRRLDGLLAMDPVALQDLMAGTGSLRVNGIPVDESNAAKVVMKDSYELFPQPSDQNVFLRALIDKFWRKVQKGELKGPALVEGLGHAVASQHLKVYSATPEEQSALQVLGADGSFESHGPSVQMIFNNNYGLNKIDYFLRWEFETVAELTPQGDALVTTTAHLENTAPAGPRSLILGQENKRLRPGENRMTLNFLVPRGAETGQMTIDGEAKFPLLYRDHDYPVPWEIVVIPPGETVTASLEYAAPRAGSNGEFDLTLFPQATAHTANYSFTAIAPEGYRIENVEEPGSPVKSLHEDGALDGVRSYRLRVVED